MKKTNELNINEYVMLAQEKVGYIGEIEFQSPASYRKCENPGQFEILAFEQHENPHFEYKFWKHEKDDTPDGAVVGYYFIKFIDTKFYNNKVMKFKVSAYVQDDKGTNSRLYIWNNNEETGKWLKAYQFPILNW